MTKAAAKSETLPSNWRDLMRAETVTKALADYPARTAHLEGVPDDLKKPCSLYISLKDAEKMKVAASLQGVPVQDLYRQLIRDYLDKLERVSAGGRKRKTSKKRRGS